MQHYVLNSLGNYTNITIAWGIGVLLGIIASQKISGAHINPAVTFALLVTKKIDRYSATIYMIAQMIGGALGALIVYLMYYEKFHLYDPTLVKTAKIFITYPLIKNTFMPGFIAEIIDAIVLMFGILMILEYEKKVNSQIIGAVLISLLIVAIGMSLGIMHGYALNPARDLAPRILITILGFKHTGLLHSTMWLAPFLGSMLGAPIGALLFKLLLTND